MNRREAMSALGRHVIGLHAATVISPILDFFCSAPSWNPNTALRGFIYGHGQALAEITALDRNISEVCGWPYLHVLCHAFAVASMRVGGASDTEAIAWSEHGGIQDELVQQYWAQWYRKEIHPRIRERLADDDEFDTAMAYVWGSSKERRGAEKKCRISKGKSRWIELKMLRTNLHLLIDACESAWQRSDEIDNATGRRIGLACRTDEQFTDDRIRLSWCKRMVRLHGIFPDTPEGPDTERPFGPFHPLHSGCGWESNRLAQESPWPLSQ